MKRSNGLAALVVAGSLAGLAVTSRAETPATGKGIHYLVLVRHGTYEYDARADEIGGNGLDSLGREQAKPVGARLLALFGHPDALVTSPYRRARETAIEIGLALHMTATIDTLIHECTPASDRADDRGGDMAASAACGANLERAWARYVTPTPDADRHDVLVCHGNVIRWFVSRAVSDDPRHWRRLDIANASLTVLAVQPDGSVRLETFNDDAHVPPAKQTWTGKGPGWPISPTH